MLLDHNQAIRLLTGFRLHNTTPDQVSNLDKKDKNTRKGTKIQKQRITTPERVLYC